MIVKQYNNDCKIKAIMITYQKKYLITESLVRNAEIIYFHVDVCR